MIRLPSLQVNSKLPGRPAIYPLRKPAVLPGMGRVRNPFSVFGISFGSLPIPQMEIEYGQRQGLPAPQPAGVNEIDECLLPFREVRLPYSIPLHGCKRPFLLLCQLREANVLAYHGAHPSAYVIVCHSHLDNLPEGDVDLLACSWLIQGIVDGQLEMAVADVCKPHAFQEG